MPAVGRPPEGPEGRAGGITSMTLLPTGTPTRPSFQPGTTFPPSWKLNGRPPGAADGGQVLLNTLPVRQMEPTYWATTVWPLASFGPEPLISVVTDSLAGGVFLGTAMTGDCPDAAVTVGSLPPPVDTCVPLAACVAENCCSRSITHTTVSL